MAIKAKKAGFKVIALLVILSLLLPPDQSIAQFLRLGPFDFLAQTRIEAIYTTNVEQERPSEATADREDFYLVWGLDLRSTAEMMPRTTITIDTGITIEEHLNRTDLNNSSAPFGRISGRFNSDWDPIKLYGGMRYERTSESMDDTFVPADLPQKRRQVGTTFEYDAGIDWITQSLRLGVDYIMTQERYDSDDFVNEEQDEETLTSYVSLRLAQNVSVGYDVEWTRTDFVNNPDGRGEWDKTETITLDFELGLWERPQITYSVGLQREREDGESKDWEWIHVLNVRDEYDLSSTLHLRGFATYKYEENPEDDDIALEFGATLTHQISDRASHSFTATRQPVDTLGSTDDTEETTYLYAIQINDFFIPDLSAQASAEHKISRPVEGETEKVWTYTAGLSRSAQLSQRLRRVLRYDYSRESSNLEFEILDEHRVTLSFIYDL